MSLESRLRHFPMRKPPFVSERTALLAPTQGRVLEVCIDIDSNLPYYSPWVTDLAMVSLNGRPPERQRGTSDRGMPAERIFLGAETAAFPFSDADFDWVVSTLTLCRLHDPAAVLQEVHRVLKPSGNYAFLEHGRSGDPGARRLQRWFGPLWPTIGGCRIDCEIDAMISGAGFRIEALDRYRFNRPAALATLYRGRARPA